MPEIDPIQYGQTLAKIDALEKQVEEMRTDVKTLLEMANKSKGGFYVMMTAASGFGAFISWVASHVFGR